ncbi:hypothetical protein HNR23_004821 [Nocardiopsis mwathae]|uniref:Uncharacterized protein n=1 Tax=Nocardiopsis mwathae TaxID=1472723 RepID=A0A7W9YPC5_9ACTN|nr:hypothetical protein [Nocardiopsis mwathae]
MSALLSDPPRGIAPACCAAAVPPTAAGAFGLPVERRVGGLRTPARARGAPPHLRTPVLPFSRRATGRARAIGTAVHSPGP